MAIELSTPSFKPREYEGEHISYTLYGLDSDGDELDDLITSPKKGTITHTIKELLPDYRRVYSGMHVVAILYDKNYRMLNSEVVWSTDQNESKGADETIEYEKGHKNSRGEDAPWVIRDHKNGKVLASFSKKDDAEAHLERMKHYGKGERLFNKQKLEGIAMHIKLCKKESMERCDSCGAIANEDGQRTEKTAWTYLGELETLEGADSRKEAMAKILGALGCSQGTEGRWYDKGGNEIDLIDVLDNTEWDFAVRACGPLQESKDIPKQEATLNALWCVEFCDIYSNVEKEYYNTEADAKARYDELAERGDIEWVETPAIETVSKAEKLSYDDYAESVKSILMGREFEYRPETANEFVVDDYKDIVRKNFDAGKGAFTAAADIDDAYMRKE